MFKNIGKWIISCYNYISLLQQLLKLFARQQQKHKTGYQRSCLIERILFLRVVGALLKPQLAQRRQVSLHYSTVREQAETFWKQQAILRKQKRWPGYGWQLKEAFLKGPCSQSPRGFS